MTWEIKKQMWRYIIIDSSTKTKPLSFPCEVYLVFIAQTKFQISKNKGFLID